MLETIRQFAEEQLVVSGEGPTTRPAHARYFAGREADILALWDGPRQREAYDWFTAELANLRTALRWAADHGDLDTAATIATYAAFLGIWLEKYEPVAWAEELIEPARAVDHPRLTALYVWRRSANAAGRIETPFATARRRGGISAAAATSHKARRLVGVAYVAVGRPERWVELCRAQLARGPDGPPRYQLLRGHGTGITRRL